MCLADAHDAGGLVVCVQSAPSGCVQSTSRWFGVFAFKVRPADAHDPGSLCPKYTQLMLRMLTLWGLCAPS